jgi:hypothetical protein
MGRASGRMGGFCKQLLTSAIICMNTLLSEVIARQAQAPVVVLFGGNPLRRHEVLELIQNIGGITAFGTLSEEEGLAKVTSLPKVDLVLIGGRYSEAQRIRIRKQVKQLYPGIPFSEPGWDYPYANEAIVKDIKQKLGIN